MNQIKTVDGLIIQAQNQNVLIDADVARLYGVETKHVNQAVKLNPKKFPPGYVFPLKSSEKLELVKNFDRFENLKRSSANPIAFTEKGLYMLATILKSPQAIATTISIVETFAKLRELTAAVAELSKSPDNETQKSLMQKSGEIMAELLDSGMPIKGAETSFEINLAVMKFKHTVKREKEDS